MSGLLFEALEQVEVSRVDDERFLADHVGSETQAEAAMCIVEVVRRAHGKIVQALARGTASQFFEVAIHALTLREEPRIEGVLVENADRVVGIGGSDEPSADVANWLGGAGVQRNRQLRRS